MVEEPSVVSEVIDDKKAEDIAISYVGRLNALTRSAVNSDVTSVYPWRYSEIYGERTVTRASTGYNAEDTLLYIVNFGNNDGYALVLADKRKSGVIAYIDNGSRTPQDEIDNPGFRLFLEGVKTHDSFEMFPIDGFGPNDPIIPPLEPEFDYWVTVAPLLTTKWGQNAPYNNYCYTSNNEQAIAGCVAIATAQICAYHQSPLSYNGHVYNWDAMLQNATVSVTDSVASNSVANLVHDIGLCVGMSYGVGSSGDFSMAVADWWDANDYLYNSYSNLTDTVVLNSLAHSRPVYIRGSNPNGGGHAWVIDGSCTSISEDPFGNPIGIYRLVHCNWGWNGYDDGYFIYGAFENKFVSGQLENGHIGYNISNNGYSNVRPM